MKHFIPIITIYIFISSCQYLSKDGEWEKIAMRNFQNTQSQRDFDMYKNIYHNLNGILKGLKEMRIKQTGV